MLRTCKTVIAHSTARDSVVQSCVGMQVYEETGFDMRPLAVHDARHLAEATIAAGNVKKPIGLFIVPDVDEHFPLAAQCEGEIAGFAWFHVDDLARVHAKAASVAAGAKRAPARFFQARARASLSDIFDRSGISVATPCEHWYCR
jgi:hypothetical protein